ncbi:MAG: VWA domain-containing protein [Pyrinomonadaceae bacterium]
MKLAVLAFILALSVTAQSQSRRSRGYSESAARTERSSPTDPRPMPPAGDDDVVRVKTDLVTVPVRVSSRDGRGVTDLKQSEFKIFENGVEQQIAYFADDDQPFTVALLLDMSYSTVFKLRDIQVAADLFIGQLKGDDRVMIVAFDEKVRVLCEATSDRRALRLAIEATRVGSGTSVYDALDRTINDRLRGVQGRKAVVLLTDGVDTSSRLATARSVLRDLSETDTLVFPIRYSTYDDVRKNRQKNAPILYDEDDRPYVAEAPPTMGERSEDYRFADRFLEQLAEETGGRLYRASTNSNLNSAFAAISAELRKTYSLGYYPSVERRPGESYTIRVRIYRPNLIIRARERFLGSRGETPR